MRFDVLDRAAGTLSLRSRSAAGREEPACWFWLGKARGAGRIQACSAKLNVIAELPPSWCHLFPVSSRGAVNVLVELFQASSTGLLDAYLIYSLVEILTEAYRNRIVPAVFFLLHQ